MRLDDHEARSRLAAHDHGVLCTVHPVRGVDAVPAVYALGERDLLGVPIDLVKPKASTRLQREHNLEADGRATLLVEQWSRDDWSQLWWVRAELRWVPHPGPEEEVDLAARLARKYDAYRNQPFARVLVFQLIAVVGWAAS